MIEQAVSGVPANINQDIVEEIEAAAADFGNAFNDLHFALMTVRHDRSALRERAKLAILSLDAARQHLLGVSEAA